ncbi:hypothetical protein U27_05596 [Candidatus Vecturithrix granuli]|uniref:Uncharacterized protein n=1 Tax=Vecturithrix granuli TaxID=1499967 RepID=A0A081C217_VECG1|nr:hypothetical protein U27_05596 [Candidatus Vecturithrix granuli]
MPIFEQIRDHLPTLYRPDKDDTGLLTIFLRAVAEVFEEINQEASNVLQSHWFAYTDRAIYSPYFTRSHQLLNLPFPAPNDPLLLGFPYIHDLARLAALLTLSPWREPPTLRELVEAYRLRIKRIVALYRNGLGTVNALRSMVEAQLPIDSELRDRPFWLEEFAPLVKRSLNAPTRGEPANMVGPLMRWTVTNDGLSSTPPTLYIQGVEPQEGFVAVAATENPLIELYQADDNYPRLGIAYLGTIDPGKTLRLRPAYRSWIGLDAGIQYSESVPTENGPADPTAPGPWQTLPGSPETTVVDIHQAHDYTLWIATNTDGAGALWRYNGQNWNSIVLNGDSQLYCLAENGEYLFIGTENGLLRMELYPENGSAFVANPISDSEGQAIYAIFHGADGLWWLGTANGVTRLNPDDTLQASALQGTEVYAISQDRTDTLYFGTALGLFQYQPDTGHWYWYEGKKHTEQEVDWKPFWPEKEGEEQNFPKAEQVFLPPVLCVHRGPDASLWIGTENGIARYVAHFVRGLTYETVLEAFPDLTTGPVFAIKEDARGLIWFCTDQGLFRYDGRDWWQFQDGVWVHLKRADTLYHDTPKPRGKWRFQRSASQWQRFNSKTLNWENISLEVRSIKKALVHTILWTDYIAADLGQWDSTEFTNPEPIDVTTLCVRYKPSEQRIVDGGIPAIPRLPVGSSIWRYLSMEPEDLKEPADRPSWTIEGRLLPPPPDLKAAGPGRYDIEIPPPSSNFDKAVFAFKPAARVWFSWEARSLLTVLVRLKKRSTDEHIDPAILDRVWQGVQQVRPAGIRTMLAVEENIVRGKNNG